ncbi:MAG TPA: hypothetical protein VGG02_04440 [Chthoniobacterales bacterium]|jgi:hypothetical protein
MKKFAPILVAAGVCLTSAALADDLPKAESFSRYEPMLKHSPFAVASAGVSAIADFAKDLYVANAAHTGSGDFVTIASTTDRNFKEYLTTKTTIDGYAVPNVQWSDRVGETKVTITKDGQMATLGFNEALLSEAIQSEAPPTSRFTPGLPGRPINIPQMPRPMNIPTFPTPQPHTRAMIRQAPEPVRRRGPGQPPLDESPDGN